MINNSDLTPYDIVIIGGGASGMIAAIMACRYFLQIGKPYKIAIIEKHNKLGRKLLATGNGRCNISNIDSNVNIIETDIKLHYYSENPSCLNLILDSFKPEDTVKFFESIGILCKTNEDGKIYPFCEQALSVVDALKYEINSLGVDIISCCIVNGISKTDLFSLDCLKTEPIHYEKSHKVSNDKQKKLNSDITTSDNTILSVNKSINSKNDININIYTPININAKKVIIASGGKASPLLSTDGLGYSLLQSFGHHCTNMFPAIVQLRTKNQHTSFLSGVKWIVDISLVKIEKNNGPFKINSESNELSKNMNLPTKNQNKGIRSVLRKESGELLFTAYGISGPPVLQLARHINGFSIENELLCSLYEFYVVIDFLSEFSTRELVGILTKRIAEFAKRPICQILLGILPLKIANEIVRKVFINSDSRKVSSIEPNELALLVTNLKSFPLKILGTTGFGEAQVTAGGIVLIEFSNSSLESKLCSGLYATGEVLDADGDCGGYNLQFAWASGYIAGKSAAISILEER